MTFGESESGFVIVLVALDLVGGFRHTDRSVPAQTIEHVLDVRGWTISLIKTYLADRSSTTSDGNTTSVARADETQGYGFHLLAVLAFYVTACRRYFGGPFARHDKDPLWKRFDMTNSVFVMTIIHSDRGKQQQMIAVTNNLSIMTKVCQTTVCSDKCWRENVPNPARQKCSVVTRVLDSIRLYKLDRKISKVK